MTTLFPPSELIINNDGSIFHLHLRPEQLASNILLVGDPDRVELVASYFDSQEYCIKNREFITITGQYQGKRISVISTGIGTDNIDIVMNELDALANINFETRTEHPIFKQLKIVRIGTSGAIQPDIELGSFVISEKSIGMDGLLNFYKNRDKVCDIAFEKAFTQYVEWNSLFASPYVIDADQDLLASFSSPEMRKGITITANGFYGPQGRKLRLELADPELNQKIESFRFMEHKVTNYEMESSAIAGLAKLMGHKAMTICCIIANRHHATANVDYKARMTQLIQTVLERI